MNLIILINILTMHTMRGEKELTGLASQANTNNFLF